MIGLGWNEGQFVVGLGVCDAFLQERGYVVIGGEGQSTALNSQDLQAQVSDLDLVLLAHTFQETLIVQFAANSFAGAQRIYAVQRYPRLPKLGR